jgi:hypothetical protein
MKFIYTILYTFICIFLFWLIVYYISNNFIIIENFINSSYNPGRETIYSQYDIDLTNHNVNLPINTVTDCKNMCGPNSQCYITREQCTSDIDCYGCHGINSVINNQKVKGYNDAGRLIYNQNPQYSALTTDFSRNASFFNGQNAKVPKSYLGVDKWMKSADAGMQFFYKSMNYPFYTQPKKFNYLPNYQVKETTTGLFEDYGPLASNEQIL